MQRFFLAILLGAVCVATAHAQTGVGFQRFLEGLRPDAQRAGVTRATFDAATRGLEPDLALPDLVIPGRPEKSRGEQPEFVQVPSAYLSEKSLSNLTTRGRQLAAQHRETLLRIEREFGVPGGVVLAIWGRETAYGAAKLPYDAIRVLATQAYVGRRKEQFREEFILALKLIQEGRVARADMKSSWAGAMGLTQFLPSDLYKNGVDFDGDGKVDIFRSVPDALASAAKQLVDKGWQRGRRWAYEVKVPDTVDCSLGHPGHTRTLREWIAHNHVPLTVARPSGAEASETASLLMPEGTYGPAFLTQANYFVIKEYNFSDLYVLFVGNLADRIAGGGAFKTPWAKTDQMRTADVESMQRRLTELGYYNDKIDGKAGMLTRAALGAYQKASGIKLDCWPTPAVLAHMRAKR